MSDEMEILLSDSSDTIILSQENVSQDSDEDPDVQALVNRYISENAVGADLGTAAGSKNFKKSFDADPDFSPIKRSKKTHDDFEETASSKTPLSQDDDDDDCVNIIEALQMLHDKYKPIAVNGCGEQDLCVSPKNKKDIKKQERELQKQKKLKEREQKKKELEREKNIKQALVAANKNLKPLECMKFITVGIDNELINEDYSTGIINALQEADVKYNIQSQIFPHTITWTRKVDSHALGDDNDKLVSTSKEEHADEILHIMNCKNFVEHVSNSTLCAHIQTLKSILLNKKVTLVIYGLANYNRVMKNQQQNEMRNQVTSEEEKHKTAKFQNFPKVTKKTIEYKLTELQLLCSCSHRLLDSALDLGLFVVQFTKAVAEIPFKLQKHDKLQQTDWFAGCDNRDCVKVDKNGNGLNRLWNQMLTTFPLARLETAEAISSKFPTVSALMAAYEQCASIKEAELLLQDIPIRRAAGPLSSSRKIGPGLSKKVYNFFTSIDGDTLL